MDFLSLTLDEVIVVWASSQVNLSCVGYQIQCLRLFGWLGFCLLFFVCLFSCLLVVVESMRMEVTLVLVIINVELQ